MCMTLQRRGLLLFAGALAASRFLPAHAADLVDRVLVVGDFGRHKAWPAGCSVSSATTARSA